MKVNFKWDGKDLYTPKFYILSGDSLNSIYFGILLKTCILSFGSMYVNRIVCYADILILFKYTLCN